MVGAVEAAVRHIEGGRDQDCRVLLLGAGVSATHGCATRRRQPQAGRAAASGVPP
jgi:hypothetical protein